MAEFKTRVHRGDYSLQFKEALGNDEDGDFVHLDFDGSAVDIGSSDYLKTTDSLHEMISEEYERCIKNPVYRYMRGNDNGETETP